VRLPVLLSTACLLTCAISPCPAGDGVLTPFYSPGVKQIPLRHGILDLRATGGFSCCSLWEAGRGLPPPGKISSATGPFWTAPRQRAGGLPGGQRQRQIFITNAAEEAAHITYALLRNLSPCGQFAPPSRVAFPSACGQRAAHAPESPPPSACRHFVNLA